MPFLLTKKEEKARSGLDLLDQFIEHPDVRERHEIVIDAPGRLVLEATYKFDIQSIGMIRALAWLRAKALGAKRVPSRTRGFVADMLALGRKPLAGS